MHTKANVFRLLLVCVAATAPACGTSSSPASPTLSPAVQTTTVTITSSGVSPNNIEVSLGARVLFVNNDSRSHNMLSDPHPGHEDCPPINSVGLLAPGRSIETGNLTTVRTCGYHDHDDTSAKWKGQITIK